VPHIVVLAVGQDRLLLETRSQVLRSAGYSVVSTLSIDQALKQFRAGDFDIVILCHSISLHDRELLTNAMRAHRAKTPVVVVTSGFNAMDPFADAIVENEPAILLQELPKVLRNNPENSLRELGEA
jgi:DNA-binding response OmpR family regulator